MPPQSVPPQTTNTAPAKGTSVVDFILSHQAPFAVSGAVLAIIVFAVARKVRGTALFPNEKNFLQLLFGGVSVAQGLALLCLCFFPDTAIKI
ncbi:MAG: hypothetical protein EOO38_19905 [Cytophagaceae bacterium]|nr:MAG: hypothetical protein EOO38_19905 [Cytophagaceae bacterium]